MSGQPSFEPVPDEEFFDFKCPACCDLVSFLRSESGQAVECPECRETFIVPEPGAESGSPLPIPLQTQRLTLRRLHPGDCDDLAGLMGDEEMSVYWEILLMGEAQVRQWLAEDPNVRLTTPNEWFYLAVAQKDTQRLIGWASIFIDPVDRRQAQLNLVIARKHQRNGFGLEVLAALLAFTFESIHLHRVTVSCDGRNEAARRLFEKAGMRCEAEFLQDHPEQDGWADTLWFALLEHEYPPSPKKPEGEGHTENSGSKI